MQQRQQQALSQQLQLLPGDRRVGQARQAGSSQQQQQQTRREQQQGGDGASGVKSGASSPGSSVSGASTATAGTAGTAGTAAAARRRLLAVPMLAAPRAQQQPAEAPPLLREALQRVTNPIRQQLRVALLQQYSPDEQPVRTLWTLSKHLAAGQAVL
jgi:hypothetical protein